MLRRQRTGELLRAATLLRLCRYNGLVKRSEKIMDASRRVLGRYVYDKAMRSTVYGHFVAGEDLNALCRVADRLAQDNVRCMYYVHIESDEGGEDLSGLHEHNTNLMLDAVDAAKAGSMVQVKLTGIASIEMLRDWSSSMQSAHSRPYSDVPSLVKSAQNPGEIHGVVDAVTSKHGADIVAIQRRLHQLAEKAASRGVMVIFDAEQTYFQPAIQRLMVPVIMRWNRSSQPVVYTTIQAYLKESNDVVRGCLDVCQAEGARFASKIVRGGYMVQERLRAEDLGYESPIWSTYEGTNACYGGIVRTMLEHVEADKAHVMVSTHNQDSVHLAQALMKERSIAPADGHKVCFAQIYGLGDYLTSDLAEEKYVVYKSVPAGPVEAVTGYIVRRAQENNAVFTRIKHDSDAIWEVLYSRWGAKPWRR